MVIGQKVNVRWEVSFCTFLTTTTRPQTFHKLNQHQLILIMLYLSGVTIKGETIKMCRRWTVWGNVCSIQTKLQTCFLHMFLLQISCTWMHMFTGLGVPEWLAHGLLCGTSLHYFSAANNSLHQEKNSADNRLLHYKNTQSAAEKRNIPDWFCLLEIICSIIEYNNKHCGKCSTHKSLLGRTSF